MKIRVMQAGVSTTIQDAGRLNGLAFGVPKGGWMDDRCAEMVNALVGNPKNYPVLEFTVVGGVYKFENSGVVALSGFGVQAYLNQSKLSLFESFPVQKGDVLNVRSTGLGRYAYLGIAGKFVADQYWGSYSTYSYAQRGGYKGRALQKGDVLEVELSVCISTELDVLSESTIVRLLPGPEFGDFSKEDHQHLVKEQLTIGKDSNRMGYRLEGIRLSGTASGNIISSGVLPGTIQVPALGEPIVLMADAPCTGGYPRIAVVHREDLGVLAQVLPGKTIQFQWCL